VIEYIFGFASLYFLTYLLLTYLEEEKQDPCTAETPPVTVLIPAYNESKTIEKTLASAIALDYPRLQIIVIDDGSADDTAEKARRTGVAVLRQKNAGKANALNNGIGHAKGEFIATLDADSQVAPDALRHMLGYFQDPKVMVVTPTMKVVGGEGTLVRLQKAEYLFSNFMTKIFSLLDSIMVTPGPFSLYRASVFMELGGFDETSHTEDNEMALRIQSKNYLIRSSHNAVVYTKVPDNLGALFRQRKRWYAGYVENLRKYSGLIRPKYGELGCFILPLTTLLVILMLAKIALDTLGFLQGIPQFSISSAPPHFLQPYELLAAFSFIIGILLFYLGILEAKETPSAPLFLHLFLMSLLSPFLYAYAFFMKAYEIVSGKSAKW